MEEKGHLLKKSEREPHAGRRKQATRVEYIYIYIFCGIDSIDWRFKLWKLRFQDSLSTTATFFADKHLPIRIVQRFIIN